MSSASKELQFALDFSKSSISKDNEYLDYKDLINTPNTASTYFRDTSLSLLKQSENPRLKHIYTVIKENGEYKYGFSSLHTTEFNNTTYTPETRVISNFLNSISFEDGYKKLKSEDQQGYYLLGVLPLFEDNFLVVHYSLPELQNILIALFLSIAGSAALLTIFFIGVGYVLYNNIRKSEISIDKYEHLAHFDALTQLPNRVSLVNRLKLAASNLDKNPTYLFALYFIDIDNFKLVNDTDGHLAGDIILQEIACFLKSQLEDVLIRGERPFASRLGGDEFVLLYPARRVQDVTKKAASILQEFQLIKEKNEMMLKHDVNISMGSSIYPNDASSVSDLLKYSDEAMYYSKKHGKGGYIYWTPEIGAISSQEKKK
ncbi:MAG: GGDEF domain-containing protein [Bacillales bacterium]|jgi:diguanylate cyclase (GGDEF)-like protein|nr:GGDEF domain-containing protein [Bacillales bacterium]